MESAPRGTPGESCWKVVPSYCASNDGAQYVMLRSMANSMVLRADEGSGALVARDVPTARTAAKYCWKLMGRVPGSAGKQGCEYSYDANRVVCMSDAGGGGSEGARANPRGPWPAMVGMDARVVAQQIQRSIPNVTIVPVPCPAGGACMLTQDFNASRVRISYDPATWKVAQPPFVG